MFITRIIKDGYNKVIAAADEDKQGKMFSIAIFYLALVLILVIAVTSIIIHLIDLPVEIIKLLQSAPTEEVVNDRY